MTERAWYTPRNLRFQLVRRLVRFVPPLRRFMPHVTAIRPLREGDLVHRVMQKTALGLPAHLTPLAARLQRKLPEIVERDIAVVDLPGGWLLGNSGALLDDTGAALRRGPSRHRGITYHDLRPGRLHAVQGETSTCYVPFLGPHRGHAHLYHYVFDRLAPLYHLVHSGDATALTLLVREDVPGHQRTILDALCRRYPYLRWQAVAADTRWYLPRLRVIDWQQNLRSTAMDRALVAWLRALIAEAFGVNLDEAAAGHKRRIFVSREDARRRRIRNERALWPILAARGIKIVQAGALPFAEQIALFAQSGVVIGAHGAGLTHLLFAPDGAKVLELFPADKAKDDYLLLSLSRGLSYHFTWMSPMGRGEHVTVDPMMVTQEIDRLLDA